MAAGLLVADRPGGALDRQTLVVAGVVILGAVMSVLDTTIVNVALDSLSRDLRSPLGTIHGSRPATCCRSRW
ncbi:MAG: hypothetical protein ACRDPC_18785 [Solirubrobacteraceae bacterium]